MIPVLNVCGRTIPEAWENSLIQLYSHGIDIATQYDKLGDPPSKDATMMIVVEDPLAEPMIHLSMPGGFEDLQEYVMEVCDGIKDHCVRNVNDPNDKRWEYTYHQRLFEYPVLDMTDLNSIKCHVDQIEQMCQQLSKCLYTRRAQAITWNVAEDTNCYDPPCLQSIFCRVVNNQLCMNVRFRSRDAFLAAFMNMFALIQLQVKIAKRVSELTDQQISLGRYVDFSDSYHIYGKDIKEFEQRFLNAYNTRAFEKRTARYSYVKDIMDEAIPGILKKSESM
jgi:thymidylate synthase